MSKKPLHYCNHPGCSTLTDKRFCPKHTKAEQKRYDKERGTAKERGYDKTWNKLRKMKLRRQAICEICNREPATLVHHMKSIKERPDLKLSSENLQSLCVHCHIEVHKKQ